MLKRDYRGQECSIARSLELIGERWTLLIIRDAFMGIRRFDDFEANLGIARNVLADRLNRLVEAGIFRRVPYSEHPPRFEYRLTSMGRDLHVALSALREWGDRYLSEEPPLQLRRRSDGQPVRAAIVPYDIPGLAPRELEIVDARGS